MLQKNILPIQIFGKVTSQRREVQIASVCQIMNNKRKGLLEAVRRRAGPFKDELTKSYPKALANEDRK